MKTLIAGLAMLALLCGTAFGQGGVIYRYPNGSRIILGGPLNGTRLPDRNGGIIVGGPLSGQMSPRYNDIPYYQPNYQQPEYVEPDYDY